MSAESWKAEFYPIQAKQVLYHRAAAHSLQKWIGLRVSNLDKHNLTALPINVDSSTCALCLLNIEVDGDCENCALSRARGGVPCDQCRLDEADCGSPWNRWQVEDNPEPMIKWLELAVKEEDQCRS